MSPSTAATRKSIASDNLLSCLPDDDVLSRKSIESDPTVWIGLAERSVQPGLGGLKQARLTVAQCTICLPNKRHEEHVVESAEEQIFQIRQWRSRSGIAED